LKVTKLMSVQAISFNSKMKLIGKNLGETNIFTRKVSVEF